MSTQRVDYVRQNIEKFAKKSGITPKRQNDENRPLNSLSKSSTKRKQLLNGKDSRELLGNQKNSPLGERKQVRTNLTAKIDSNKNLLTNKLMNDKVVDRQPLIRANSANERRLSNDKAERRQSNDKLFIKSTDRRLSNEKATNDGQSKGSTVKPGDRRQSNEKATRPSLERRQSNDKANAEKRQSNEKLSIKSSDRRLSNEKAANEKSKNERRQSNEKASKINTINDKVNDKQTKGNSTFEKPKIAKSISSSNDKLAQTKPISNSTDKLAQQKQHTKPINIQLNDKQIKTPEDLRKNHLYVENELLKMKYLNAKCESKMRKQNQQVNEIVKNIFNLIQMKRVNCLELEKELSVKETLLLLIKLSEQSIQLLKEADLTKIEVYLKSISNIINSSLSTTKVNQIKNARNINEILDMTTTKLISDLKMDTVQEFSDKIRQFDLVNNDINQTIEHICSLKTNLMNEVEKRIELKNIY